ncbi:hypothetical protein DYB38_011969 [Aphanomyces astaci]|uniref:C2 domain-containing protein n=2 Tax=Aphanomyces astaci TaxID=112090 RepID=A0A397CVK7_APHAT|nr:hypothetical protein DYB38_011969 [Aphanomyces astaci]
METRTRPTTSSMLAHIVAFARQPTQSLRAVSRRRCPPYTPSSVITQGSLRLWLDILTPVEATASPAVDISLPPIETFEVRVVIYKAKDVVPGDELSELSDLFVKCWMQSNNDKAQHTDIHRRAKNGKASFNWRMKFDIALPVDPQNELDKGTYVRV